MKKNLLNRNAEYYADPAAGTALRKLMPPKPQTDRTLDIMSRYYLYARPVCEIARSPNCSRRAVQLRLRAGECT